MSLHTELQLVLIQWGLIDTYSLKFYTEEKRPDSSPDVSMTQQAVCCLRINNSTEAIFDTVTVGAVLEDYKRTDISGEVPLQGMADLPWVAMKWLERW